MAMLTGQWGEFVEGVSARIDEVIDQTKDYAPNFMASGIFDQVQSDGEIYRTEGVTGLSYLKRRGENEAIKEDQTYPAYKTEYVMTDYGVIISISQKLAYTRAKELDNKLDEVGQAIEAATRTLNKGAWQVLINGFSTTDLSSEFPIYRLSDAVSMFSTAHTSRVAGVSNRSNRLAGNPSFSESTVFDLIKMIREQLNGRGLPIGLEDGSFLLVGPPALDKKAFEYCKSTGKADTSDNNINYYNGVVDYMSVNYLGAAAGGSDTAYYMFAKVPKINSMKYVTLIAPKVEKEVDFNTKAIRVSIDGSWAFGYSTFEFSAASDGLNA